MTKSTPTLVEPRSSLYLVLNQLHRRSGNKERLIDHIDELRQQDPPHSFDAIAYGISVMAEVPAVVTPLTVRNWLNYAKPMAA